MRRYFLYLTVAILAFGVGTFTAFRFYWKNTPQKTETQKTLTAPKLRHFSDYQEQELITFKYGCKEKEIETLWENLDKSSFFNFKKASLRELNRTYPLDFQRQWNELSQNFDCSYFEGIEWEEDLNNDGVKEILVRGESTGYRADFEAILFQKQGSLWRVILYEYGIALSELKPTKHNNYFDVMTETSVSGGSHSYSTYEFNGKMYKARKCFSEDTWIKKKEYMVELEKPLVTRIPCNQ